jgi:uncharacterized DUF497 family protein
MTLTFEWSEAKALSNLGKHGVDFEEAQTVFRDPFAWIFDDEWHAQVEEREIIIGHSANKRLLLVCFTERGNSIRIISARQANSKERRDYEENTGFSFGQ